MTTKTILERAFFGKTNCLKTQLNSKGEFYFQFGTQEGSEWKWKNIKMNDMELGDILLVLEGNKQSTSFIHDFKGDKTQLWISKKEDAAFFKIKETTKGLNLSEVIVLRELIKHSIVRMNIKI
jgi:hypothetical protein